MVGMLTAALQKFWRRIAPRRTDILGREQGQAIVRVVVTCAVLGWFVVQHSTLHSGGVLPYWPVFFAAFLIFSAGMVWLTQRDTRSPAYRRITANVADITAITGLMSTAGDAGMPLFVLYLWVTLGNGFRFGLVPMGISTALSAAGFTAVFLISEVWTRNPMFSFGVMAALLVLPAYAAHLIEQLHRAHARAAEASAAKSQLLTRMSQELRIPLNGIHDTTGLLRNSRRWTSEERELLGVIQESAAVMQRQISSVLDFARIEAGKLVLEQSDFDLHRLLHGTARLVIPAAREKNLRLLVRIAPQTPFRLMGDAQHLREILLNLLSNAVKFTHTGYVALQVEPVSAGDDVVRLRFEIRDTGVGIAPGALERIWEGFARENNEAPHQYVGAGLGATIAKRLVEFMGGRIAVSSIKGRGTVFWCELPFHHQADAGHTVTVAAGTRTLFLSSDRATEEHIREHVQGLRGLLVTVASVNDAVAALGRGIRLGNPWHLVLVDEKLAVTPGDRNLAGDLMDKALAAQTPVYLVSDHEHDIEQLCDWGYAATLPSRPSAAIIAQIIHASPHYEPDATSSAGVVQVEPWAWGRQGKFRRRILVADDIRTNRLILQQILESAGYDVDAVEDGEVALKRLAAGGYKAAVLDLHMPGFDGVNLLRRYRLFGAAGRVPIIMLTADITFGAQSDCAEAGADAFLTKPVTADMLLSTVERLIQDQDLHVLHADTGDDATVEPADGAEPVLDLSVLAELDRICGDPMRFAAVVDTFEAEAESLLTRLSETVRTHNYPAFLEWVHAMKGNAANVGAIQLVAACLQVETTSMIEFRRGGSEQLRQLNELFSVARQALRELAPHAGSHGQSGPV
jgi:two-component system sensor histidine kinase RpfC